MGGYDNSLIIEFTQKRRKAGIINAIKSGKLYQEYLNHPTAQYQMTFLEYKKKRKKILSDGPVHGFDRAKSKEMDDSVGDDRKSSK
jgi:hypothetical protein